MLKAWTVIRRLSPRLLVQCAFVILCVWIGVEFALFMRWGASAGEQAFVARPPGVEGFLPISSLMSLWHWVLSGKVNGVHPAGLFIFVAIALTALIFKKAFCSWLCPIGTLSEWLWLLGRKILGQNLKVPRALDWGLRSLKYVLLAFFCFAIFSMSQATLERFIYSPYNKVADIKMYLFFADISAFALWTLIILAVLSMLIQGFWCRYLCPYGGLLGLLSLVSPFKISRNEASCTECRRCTKACPAAIKVHVAHRVVSDECMSCYRCVDACPEPRTLEMRARRGLPLSKGLFAVLVLMLFCAVTGAAMLSGHWHNEIGSAEYLRRFGEIKDPANAVYQHNRGQVPDYGPED